MMRIDRDLMATGMVDLVPMVSTAQAGGDGVVLRVPAMSPSIRCCVTMPNHAVGYIA